MAKSREINMNLPSVDDLFTTQEERDQKNQEYIKEIEQLLAQDEPPECIHKSTCKKCAYYEYCYI